MLFYDTVQSARLGSIAEAVIYITLLAMLLLRPQGFFGVKEA